MSVAHITIATNVPVTHRCAIAHILAEIRVEEILLERRFSQLGAQPRRLTYKALCRDPSDVLGAVAAVCEKPASDVEASYDDVGRYDVDGGLPSKDAVANYFRESVGRTIDHDLTFADARSRSFYRSQGSSRPTL